MRADEFNALVEHRLDAIKRTLLSKAAEYADDENRLHNFDRAAQVDNVSPARALHGFWLKHYISYLDILDRFDKGIDTNYVYLDEKLGDMINYLILQEAVLKRGTKKSQNG